MISLALSNWILILYNYISVQKKKKERKKYTQNSNLAPSLTIDISGYILNGWENRTEYISPTGWIENRTLDGLVF